MNTNNYIWAVFLALIIFASGACNLSINLSQGSGDVITEKRPVSDFDSVRLTGIGDVTLTQGNQDELKIEAEDNVLPHIKTEVVDGVLEISYDSKSIIPTKSIKFLLTMKTIHGLETLGLSNIHSEHIETDELNIIISGTGSVEINKLTAQNLSVNMSGAGNFHAEGGQVGSQKVSLSGAGSFTGEDIQSSDAEVTITGLGNVSIWASDKLDVTISGTGGVEYYGSPKIHQNISGLGKLTSKGNK